MDFGRSKITEKSNAVKRLIKKQLVILNLSINFGF